MLYVFYHIFYFTAKSLEYFLNDLLIEASERAADEKSSKVYGYHM